MLNEFMKKRVVLGLLAKVESAEPKKNTEEEKRRERERGDEENLSLELIDPHNESI
jgi:hypothetical protein